MVESLPFKFNKKDVFFVFFIVLLALIVRVLYFNDYRTTDIYPLAQYSDGYSYFLWAKDIASGDLLGARAFMKWPLYAYFSGFLFKLFGEDVNFIYVLQFILGALNCALIYLIARLNFNEVVAFISGLLCAVYGLFVFYDGLFIYTSLSLFLNSLLFLYLLFIQNKLGQKNLFVFGVLLGVATITQANIVIFGVAAIAWLLWQERLSFSRLYRKALSFLLGLSLVIGLVTVRNYIVERDMVLIAGNTGINFFIGNNGRATGIFDNSGFLTPTQEGMFRDSRVIAKLQAGRELKTSEVSVIWLRKSLEFIKNSPSAYFKLVLKKIDFLFNPNEVIHDPEFSLVRDKIGIFKVMLMNLKFILPLCFLGLIFNLRNFKRNALLYIILAAFSVSILAFFVTTRYRIVMVPFMIIFAASAIFSFVEFIKKRYKCVSLGLLIAILLFIWFANRASSVSSKPADERNVLSSYQYHFDRAILDSKKSEFNSALRHLEEALRLHPNSHYAEFALGSTYYAIGDLKTAEEKFKKAINISPFFVDAYYNLGFIYNQEGRFTEARQILQEGAFLDPDDFSLHFELGRAFKAEGKIVEAKKEFILAMGKINRWRYQEKMLILKELNSLTQ